MQSEFYKPEMNSKDLKEKVPYIELVGCLLYVTQTTRPDLCFSVNYLSRYQSNPKEIHRT